MLKTGLRGLIPMLLLVAGCAGDPWEKVPEFERLDFTCPVAGGKFLEDANFVSAWSLLGPVDSGETPSIHTEYLPDEAVLNGNRNAPKGLRWQRITARNTNVDAVPGQVDFSSAFRRHPRGGGRKVFYACATLKCDRDYHGMIMHVGSCGQIKVWINGRAVYSCEKGSAVLKPDTAGIGELAFREGCNRIVVKYLDDGKEAEMRRKFSLRFTDAVGALSVVR